MREEDRRRRLTSDQTDADADAARVEAARGRCRGAPGRSGRMTR